MSDADEPLHLGGRALAAAREAFAGAHRCVAPAATLRRITPLLAGCGVTRLAELGGLDVLGVPVFQAVRPDGRAGTTTEGKGWTPDAARVSALMEALEIWHAERFDPPVVVGSFAELRGRLPLVDPTRLPRSPRLGLTPEQLRARSLRWVEGAALPGGEPRWVPLELVALRRYPGAAFASHTNGLASGNHLLEAIVHGLCERIERDAHVRWVLDAAVRRVDLAGLEDPRGRAVLARLDELGAVLGAFAQTSDIGVPAYHCTLLCPAGPRQPFPAWTWGCGCHLDPTVALLRALGEAIQVRAVFLSGRRDDLDAADYAATMDAREIELRIAEVRATPCSETFVPRPLAPGTLQADLRRLVGAVEAVGGEVVVVDLTRAELGLPVVRVLTPGLEGHPHYDAPGVRTAVPR